ncbi:MAG: hypothetical protein C4524_08460 [Candidatus Zixiibacteriota bacterium]|nr:MAG: hypothetical protein C4524_08460 [candidate division Zixibacteria bacterium]
MTSPLPARTAAFEDSAARAEVQRAVELTFKLEYDQALAVAADLESRLPDHPLPPLLRVGVLYCRMLDYEDMLDREEFDRYYDIAWDRAKKLKKGGEKAEADLYFGVLIGFKALLHQRLGQWWPAVRQGMESVDYLESCLEQDGSYADALLGVGTYRYWRSRATDFINWLPLIPDEKEKGITMVQRAMDEGLFGREISRSTLAWILIDHGRPSQAVTLSLEGLRLYPGSRFYLWTLADGYMQSGQWRRAAETYQELYDSLHPQARNNHYNEVGLCKQLARCHLRLQNYDEAMEWVERGLALPLDDTVRKRREKDMDRLKALKADIVKQAATAQKK